MSARLNLSLILIVLAAILIRMSVFSVDEREYAVKFQFREIVKEDFAPGLHFKIPFVNTIAKYPKRTMIYEPKEEEFLTGEEKKSLIVDFFVTWRVDNPGQYYRAVNGNRERAVEQFSAIIKASIKAEFSRRTVQEVVSAERSELLEDMLVQVRERAKELGVDVVDVRVKRIDLPDEVSGSVYQRMQQERQRVASQLRAEGEEEFARTSSNAERQRTLILAEAYRDAERTRGAGDARAAEIYAQAYTKDPDFYAFYRSMQAYREAIGGEQDVLVLQPDSDFFQFLQKRLGTPAK